MTTPCFYLNVAVRGYDAEVFLNGAPILQCERANPCLALPTVSEWMVRGENVLSVIVTGGEGLDPLPEGEAPPSAPARPSEKAPLLRVALGQGELGELVQPGEENESLVLEWVPPARPAALPHEERATINLQHPWGKWSWESGPTFDFAASPQARVELVQFLRDLHARLGRGQLDPLLDASRPKFDEVASCYDLDPGQARGELAAAWPEITAAVGWRLAPFDEDDLELRLCCGGRVLEPRTLAGEPILRQAVMLEGMRWMMPLFVARIGDRLMVVR